MSNHLKAGIMIALLIVCIRVAAAFNVNWIMLLPMFFIMVPVTRLSPPVSALSLLYGWVLFGNVNLPSNLGGIHIPVMSFLTAWIIILLIYRRHMDGTLRYLLRWTVWTYILLVMAFFATGFLVALYNGFLSNPFVQYYNWDIFRGWMGFFAVGILGCRNLNDMKVIFIGLPIAFMIYPLSLPVSLWQNLLTQGIYSGSVFSIGLGYGSLNPNVLGQAAALAGVVSAGNFFLRKSKILFWITIIFFAGCFLITILTASRQAILSLVTGLCIIGLVSGFRRGVIVLLSMVFLVYFGGQVLIGLLPTESGFQLRLLELTEPVETWKSQSFTIRYTDFIWSLQKWWESPFVGMGFGGQNYEALVDLDQYNNFLVRGTHNLFIGILVQTGILGFCLFLLFVLGILGRFFRFLDCAPPPWRDNARHSRVVIIGSMFCIFIQQNISGGLGVGSTALIFMMGSVLGVIGAGTKQYSLQAE
ncbi:MAG: O-antigen ligase family protein [Firmicutes bacterium]|nr:O-antigen ligase family protein [Bacillota bacterium]